MDFSSIGGVEEKPSGGSIDFSSIGGVKEEQSQKPSMFKRIWNWQIPVLSKIPGAIQKTTSGMATLADKAGLNTLGSIYRKEGEILSPISKIAIPQTGGDAILQALTGVGARIVGPMIKGSKTAEKVIGQTGELLPAIPGKYGTAVLKKPSILRFGVDKIAKEVGEAYRKFETDNGLLGIGDRIKEMGDRSASSLKDLLDTTYQKVIAPKAAPTDLLRAGVEEITTSKEELYAASRAVNEIKRMSKYDADARTYRMSQLFSKKKKAIEDALEEQAPGYAKLRLASFEQKANEAFSNIFPQTLKGTPRVARSYAASAGALEAMDKGRYAGVVLPPLISPIAWKLGIMAGRTPLGKYTGNVAAREAAQALIRARQQQSGTPNAP